MIGYLRLLLAFGVMLYHINLDSLISFGSFCVMIFYILAGSVSAKLLNLYSIKDYLKDRFLRIYPMFFIYMSLAFIFAFFSGFLEFQTDFIRTLLHFTLIPMNYYQMIDFRVTNGTAGVLLPPTFSLGLEVQIYMIFALLFALKKEKFMRILAVCSFVIFTISNLEIIDDEMIYGWDYFYFWGVFFVFYIGKLIREKNIKELKIWWISLLIVAVSNIYFCDAYGVELPYSILFGIPLVYELSQIKFKAKFNKICGASSYHIFLNHPLIIEISLWKFDEIKTPFVIIFSILLGLIIHKFIEKPIERIRLKIQ